MNRQASPHRHDACDPACRAQTLWELRKARAAGHAFAARLELADVAAEPELGVVVGLLDLLDRRILQLAEVDGVRRVA